MKNISSLLLFIILCIFSGCTNELYENTENISKEGSPVTFSIQSANTSQRSKTFISDKLILNGYDTLSPRFTPVESKSPSVSPIPIGTTIRVVAYKRSPGNKTPDTSIDKFITSQSYKLSGSNILTPVNVNAEGSIIPGSATEMYLPAGEYDFYAYSPAIPMLNDSTVAIPQGTDYITTSLLANIVNTNTNTINLPNFDRRMAQIELIIQADPSATEITSIEPKDPGIALILPGTATMNAQIGNQLNTGGAGSYYVIPEDSCKEVSATKIICTACVFPTSNSVIGIEMNLEIDDEVKFYNAFIDPATFTEGNKYIYQINIKSSNIDIKPVSNSYMVQPGKPIMFPVNQIEAMGSFNAATQTWEASVYWQTSPGLIDIMMEDQSKDLLQVKSNGEGNALIIVTPANSNTILWSWHIWSTNYIPDEGLSAPVTSSVPGGRVIRLNSSPFAGKSIVMMDRNMGAMSASHDSSSWGMYYQWGRKDPFPPSTRKVYGEQISYSLAYLSSYYTSILNPTTFYYGYFNWLLNGSNYLWTSPEKSIFDPCPPGWRVPTSATFNVPMANTIKWSKSPGIYNDGATYTPQNVWYPAQGAIDYFTGNIKWKGQYAYLWCTTTGFFDDSYSLAISRNYNTYAEDNERAYGMPVRCIQNK
ncbi:MAG: BF2992 family fimbrillin-A clan protein [Bacteroidales bacterium]